MKCQESEVLHEVVLFGNGGHARMVKEIFEQRGVKVLAFVVPSPARQHEISEEYFIKNMPSLNVFVALGDNKVRAGIVERLKNVRTDFRFPAAIHPHAVVSDSAEYGEGTCVMAGVIINGGSRIGPFSIINTGACIDHDCRLEPFSFIGPGAHLGGAVSLGKAAMIGLGANVIQGVKIGGNTLVGAGATVIGDLPENVFCVGVPAQIKRVRGETEPFFSALGSN